MVIVSLSTVNPLELSFNKSDYTTIYIDCQEEKQKTTMEYNYITTEEYLQSQIQKYQDVIP